MTMPKLVVATNNEGKLREFARLLDGCGFDLTTPSKLGVPFDVEETESTFRGNARLKAEAAMRATGFTALADDSGLEVDALGGRPGVLSARYAGPGRTDPNISEAEQLRLLLRELEGVPDEQRTARFVCVIAIATPDGQVRYAEAAWEGRIAHEPQGTNGFGYDPIFLVPERGVTSAELPPEEKNAMSHRGQAARKAREVLKGLGARG